MILDELVLDNLGVYAGRQSLDLRPLPGRPIVLVGAQNGGGKTTLLDAIQLALYGPKARLSNRGRLPWADWLRESIHRGSDPGDGAGVTLRYQRWLNGQAQAFEVQRHWRVGVRGVEEHFRVLRDGLHDPLLSEHWDEHITAFLPVRLAHLFFFDGEQIATLAEGEQTAEIIGSAIDGLLGLDLLERLRADLRVFERGIREQHRVRGVEDAGEVAVGEAQAALEAIDRELEQLALAQGAITNALNPLTQAERAAEERFREAGGDLLAGRDALEREQAALAAARQAAEGALRDLLAGPLPLLLVDDLLGQITSQARREAQIRHARLLAEALAARDAEILSRLAGRVPVPEVVHSALAALLEEDRGQRAGLADAPLLLDADEQLAPRLDHLRGQLLPTALTDAKGLLARLADLAERQQRLAEQLARIPAAAHVADLAATLAAARAAVAAKVAEQAGLRERVRLLNEQRTRAEQRLAVIHREAQGRWVEADDDRRLLHHAGRARDTLARLRERVAARHLGRIEALMLEALQTLLHKPGLIRALTIDPADYSVHLIGADGQSLPFRRLSAGERQLLATAMLWGLARVSGRPVPTVIDTPLGRLDSSHRRNLVERYFPQAAHQVLLLSTDEELVGPWQDAIAPAVARHYLLAHNPGESHTRIERGYFIPYEAAS